jgi:hypothetical protein
MDLEKEYRERISEHNELLQKIADTFVLLRSMQNAGIEIKYVACWSDPIITIERRDVAKLRRFLDAKLHIVMRKPKDDHTLMIILKCETKYPTVWFQYEYTYTPTDVFRCKIQTVEHSYKSLELVCT